MIYRVSGKNVHGPKIANYIGKINIFQNFQRVSESLDNFLQDDIKNPNVSQLDQEWEHFENMHSTFILRI